MSPTLTLSEVQLAAYRDQGFLVLRGRFDETELAPWRKRFAQIVESEVEPAPGMLVMRGALRGLRPG